MAPLFFWRLLQCYRGACSNLKAVLNASQMEFTRLRQFLFALCYSLPIAFILACWRPPSVGVGGHYNDAKIELARPRGDMDKTIANLNYVMQRDPLYRDSLTLLGRAYYKKGLYRDAFQILTRAVAANKEDEIGWIMLGLTQLRVGDNAKAIESLKGGLTLFSKASKDGYRGIEFWDKNGLVRSALRRAAFEVTKGPENKEAIIRSNELLVRRVDDEELSGSREQYNRETASD